MGQRAGTTTNHTDPAAGPTDPVSHTSTHKERLQPCLRHLLPGTQPGCSHGAEDPWLQMRSSCRPGCQHGAAGTAHTAPPAHTATHRQPWVDTPGTAVLCLSASRSSRAHGHARVMSWIF